MDLPHALPPGVLGAGWECRSTAACGFLPGHQLGGGRLPAACPHGLPHRPAPAHAGLLAEGPQ